MSESGQWESDDPSESPVQEAKTVQIPQKSIKEEPAAKVPKKHAHPQTAPDLSSIVKHRTPLNKESISRNDIQIALSGSKLVFTNDGIWRDASDKTELMESVHPIIAENVNLRRRAELLVRLVAKSEYENQQVEAEMKECDELIKQLKAMLGEQEPERQPDQPSETDF